MTTVAELRRMADVQEHYERGGKVEFRFADPQAKWTPAPDPNWKCWSNGSFRIAPEPRKARECWRFQYADGRLSGLAYPTEDQCRDSYEGAGRPVRFVEAMDEPAREER